MPETQGLHRILYVSLSNVAPSGPEICDIARVSLARNSEAGVTGFLYYDDEAFMQVLEGLEPDVAEIYASIRRDDRHRQISALIDAPASKRCFGGWAMGFYDGTAEPHPDGLGRSGFHGRAQKTDPAALLRMLRELTLDFRNVRLVSDRA